MTPYDSIFRIESYGKVPHFPPTLGNELNINLLAQFKALVKRSNLLTVLYQFLFHGNEK